MKQNVSDKEKEKSNDRYEKSTFLTTEEIRKLSKKNLVFSTYKPSK